MDAVVESLNQRKIYFLNRIQSRVRSHIISTGKNCIAVVEKSSDGEVLRTWECHLDNNLSDFCKVLYRFARKHKHKNHDLDSALTEPISKLVETESQEFYQSESDAISTGMLNAPAADEIKLTSFVGRITDIALTKFSAKVKRQVVTLVVHQIKESIAQGTLHNIGQHISHIAMTAAGTQVATIVAQLLIKLLAANICHIVAKILASAFLKKLIAILVKKIVITAVASAVLQFLGTHVGAAVGGSTVMWIVAPLLVAYIKYKITTFREKLGDEVSKDVRKQLEARFESTNRSILEKVFEAVFEGDELVDAIVKDKSFQMAVEELGSESNGQKKCEPIWVPMNGDFLHLPVLGLIGLAGLVRSPFRIVIKFLYP